MAIINGEKHLESVGMTVTQYLESMKYVLTHIVVEYNYIILPKNKYDCTIINDSDEIEIVTFMGGG